MSQKKTTDIRDQAYLSGEEVGSLNFIRQSDCFVFRKYYRSGLRSHIFEVLLKQDIEKETRGELLDGVKVFPRARPVKMFRILRGRFTSKEAVFKEIHKYTLLLTALGPDLIATSEECIVDYTGTGKHEIVLCGLQEFVEGEILDPWRPHGKDYFSGLFLSMPKTNISRKDFILNAKNSIAHFVSRIRKMVTDTGYIPDLAGIGNLIITRNGNLKLVDINNIVRIRLDQEILLDDKGYPSCDVSVDVLSILEQDMLQRKISSKDPLYRHFLSPERKRRVKALEKKFYTSL